MLVFWGLALLSAILVAWMIRVGALDHPVARSSHSVPTPKGGGVGIVAAMLAGTAWAASHGAGIGAGIGAAPLALIGAAAFLGMISYLDDLYDWPFLAKLAAQAVACAGFMLAGGVIQAVALPGGGAAHLGMAGPFITLCWLLFVTNAVNFMDGLNGLASGSVALAALAALSVAPAWYGALLLPMVAGITGFLPFNYPRARIFMGDVGSQPIGFAIAAYAVLAAGVPGRGLVVLMTLVLALTPMLADVAYTLVRRAREGARLTQAHRSHLYQVANRAGMPAWQVTLVYWGMAAACAAWGNWAGHAAAGDLAGAAIRPGILMMAAGIAGGLGVFGVWAGFVVRLAARAGLTCW